jgi:hypothetical protein
MSCLICICSSAGFRYLFVMNSVKLCMYAVLNIKNLKDCLCFSILCQQVSLSWCDQQYRHMLAAQPDSICVGTALELHHPLRHIKKLVNALHPVRFGSRGESLRAEDGSETRAQGLTHATCE